MLLVITSAFDAFTKPNAVNPMNTAIRIENAPYFWTKGISYEDFYNLNAITGFDAYYELQDDSTKLTQFVQSLLNHADAIIKTDYLAKISDDTKDKTELYAPTPMAKVVVSSSEFNAWVSSVPVGIGAQFGSEPQANTAVLLDPGHVSLLDYDINQFKQTRQGQWTVAGATEFWNSGKPRCRIKNDVKNPLIVVARDPENCIDSEAQGSETLIASTAQFIHITTDLLASLTRLNDAIVIITHELGHYYLGHTTDAMRARLNYWFNRDENNVSIPIKSAETEKFKQAYLEVFEKGHPNGVVPFADQSGFSPRMRGFLLSGLTGVFENQLRNLEALSIKSDSFPCLKAYELSLDTSSNWRKEVSSAIAPKPENIKLMEKYFSLIKKCSTELFLKDGSEGNSLSASAVFKAGRNNLPGMFVKISVRPGMSLFDFINDLNNKALILDQKRIKLLEQVSRNHVGLYTTEQAADEFGMILAMKMGLSKEEIIETWFRFMEAIDFMIDEVYGKGKAETMHQLNNEMNAKECRLAYTNGFTTINSKKQKVPMQVSLGNLEDSHHATCYRIYNLWKILNADNRKGDKQKLLPQPQPEFLKNINWEELRDEAKSLSGNDRRYDANEPAKPVTQ